MADQKAYVYADSDGVYHVHPPVVVLSKTGNVVDKFELVNVTGADFVFGIEEGAFNPVGNGPEAKPLKKNSKVGPLTPQVSGAYSYSVVATKTGKKAKGNSDPVIIIDI